MKEEIFETVLNEISEELRQHGQSAKSLRDTVQSLRDSLENVCTRVDSLSQQLAAQPLIAPPPPPDLQPLRETLELGLASLRKEIADGIAKLSTRVEAIEAQPKPIIRQFRLSLFSENDYQGNYKYFISRLFLSIVVITILAGSFALLRQHMDNNHLPGIPPPPTSPAQPITPLPPADRTIPARHRSGKNKKNILDTLNKADMHGNSDSLSTIQP